MPNGQADRNLLFGILALQMDFISSESLIRAMNAWVLEKTKPLGQVLVDQKALAADAHALLSALVAKHLELHSGDPKQSLAAIGADGVARKALERIADPEVKASIARLAAGAPSFLPIESTLIPCDKDIEADERFEILRPHAFGALGEVFVALDRELNREVALKRIHERHADKTDSRQRFLLEAEITGGLEHPGIVPVYAMGVSDDGRPHYVMRFIRGETLDDAIRQFHSDEAVSPSERRLVLRQLLGRFLAVCNAVEYAHSRGVIHRDLKPSNIMLGKYGETLVVDWGLAKSMGHRVTEILPDEATLVPMSGNNPAGTLPGSTIGTPAFMSPEQASGRIEEIGPASDIYSLGATLYTLLTGREPYEGSDLGAVLARVRSGDLIPPRDRNRTVPAALNAIVLKAMSHVPAERYATCAALAGDIEHWLADEPISVFVEPLSTRALRWIRWHRGLTASAAGLIVAALISLGIGTILLSEANSRTEAEAREAKRQRGVAEDQRKQAERQKQVAEEATLEATTQRDDKTRQLYVSQMNVVERAWDDNNVGRAIELLEGQTPRHTGGIDLRGWEWNYRWRLCHSEFRSLKADCRSFAISPDGQFLYGGCMNVLRIWNGDGTRELRSIPAHNSRVDRIALSRDGKLMATASPDGTVKLWEIAAGKLLQTFPGYWLGRYGLALSPDGKRIAIGAPTVVIWETASGRKLQSLPTGGALVRAIVFSPDGSQLVSGSDNSYLVLWDVATGTKIRGFAGHKDKITALAFHPNGKSIVSGSYDGSLKSWDVATGRESKSFKGHLQEVTGLVFNPDLTRLASSSEDSTATIWDPATGGPIQTFKGHAQGITGLAFSPTGNFLATASWDDTIRFWDAASRQEPQYLRQSEAAVTSIAYSPDNARLAAISEQRLTAWDASTGQTLWTHDDAAASTYRKSNALRFDVNNQFLAAGLKDGTVRIRDAKDGHALQTIAGHKGAVTSVDISRDGRMLAAGGEDHLIFLWSLPNARQVAVLKGHTDIVTNVAFSSDGRLLASAGGEEDRQARLWNVVTKSEKQKFVGHEGGIHSFLFSHDGRKLITGSKDDTIRWWDVTTGQMERSEIGHSGTVEGLSLSPDGKRLASCSDDLTVKIWDVASNHELQTLKPEAGGVFCVAFSTDGTRVAAGTERGHVVIWDSRPRPAAALSGDLGSRVQQGLFKALAIKGAKP